MPNKKNNKEIILKDLDGWVEVFIFDPLTLPLIKPLSKISTNPLVYTSLTIIITLVASFSVLEKQFVIASILYFLSVVTDGIDGKIARYNNQKIIIHGVLDVMTDQLRNAVFMISLYFALPQFKLYLFIFILALLTYEFSYAIRLEMKTRNFNDQPRNYSLKQLKDYYEKQISKGNSHLRNLLDFYNLLFNLSSKFRTYPFPTIVDAEFLLFIVFVATQKLIVILLAILFLVPDISMSIFLTLTLATRLQKAKTT